MSSRANTPSTSPRRSTGSPSRRGLPVRWLRCVPSPRREISRARTTRVVAPGARARVARSPKTTRRDALGVYRVSRWRRRARRPFLGPPSSGFRPVPCARVPTWVPLPLTTPRPSPSALSLQQVKKFAQKTMKTSDVRVDVKLNKAIWSKGIRNVRTHPARATSRRDRHRVLLGFSPTAKSCVTDDIRSPPVPTGPPPHPRADLPPPQRR